MIQFKFFLWENPVRKENSARLNFSWNRNVCMQVASINSLDYDTIVY